MIIEIPKLSPEGAQYEGELTAEALGWEAEAWLRLKGPVGYCFFVQLLGHELLVQGTLQVPLEAKCSRCAGFFSTMMRDLAFLRSYELAAGQEAVELSGDLREEILLHLPRYPLCRPACRGLCAQCGKNLNKGPCGCKPPAAQQWSALDGLKLN